MIFTSVYICEKEKEEPEALATTLNGKYFSKNVTELEALRTCLSSETHRPLSKKCVALGFERTRHGKDTAQSLRNVLKGGRTKSYWQTFMENFAGRYREEKKSRSGAIFFSLFVLGRLTRFAILRFDFEASVLQIVRETSRLSAISNAIVPENVKKCLVYPYVERRTGKPSYETALVYQVHPSAYFPGFCALESAPTSGEIAKSLSATVRAGEVEISSIIANLSSRVSEIRFPYVAPARMVVDMDGIEIRFRYDECGKKIHFCERGDRKVALVVGSSIVPKYGGEPLIPANTVVKGKRVDDLNSLVT